MNEQLRGNLIQRIADNIHYDQLDGLVRNSFLHHSLEYYAISRDLPTIVDTLLNALEMTGELVPFLVYLRDKCSSNLAIHSTISAYLGLADISQAADKPIKLLSSRPVSPVPDDYAPCRFYGQSEGDSEPVPMQAHVSSWDETDYPKCCFLFGTHGQDLQWSLVDVEDGLARHGPRTESTIWIRDDRLFVDAHSSAMSAEETSLL